MKVNLIFIKSELSLLLYLLISTYEAFKNRSEIQFVLNVSIYWNLFLVVRINRLDLNYLRPIHPNQERLVPSSKFF